MTKRARSKILYRIMLWVAPVSVGALFAAYFLFSFYMGKMVSRYVPESNTKTAENVALEVAEFVDKSRVALETAAGPVSAERSRDKKEYILRGMLAGNLRFKSIRVLDADGDVLAAAKRKAASRKGATLGAESADGYVSGVYFSGGKMPFVTVCMPIEVPGAPAGAICGELDFSSVWAIFDNTRIGRTGYAVLVSKDGTLLSHPDKKLVLREARIPRRETRKLIRQGESYFTIKENGEKFLATYAPVPDTDWNVIVKQDSREAYRHYILLRRYVLALTASLVLCVIAAVVAVSRGISRPIERLTQATKAVAAGDLRHSIDVTRGDELGTLAESFNAMVRQLDSSRALLIQTEKLSSVGRFAAGVVHEIKNPLSGLLGYVYLLKKQPPPEQVAEFAEDMETEISNINTTLERLLSMSRRSAIEFTDVDLNGTAERGVKLLEYHFNRLKRISTDLDLENGLPPVRGDENLLHQAVVNLLLNAYDSIEEEGRIRISTRCADGLVELRVADSGCGIAEEDLNRIFEPFHSKGKKNGTGLGLYISNEIVALHNGVIKVESRPGEGTEFTLAFKSSGEVDAHTAQKGEDNNG